MKRRIVLCIVASLALFAFIGCTSDYTLLIKDAEQTFYQGKYKDGARKLLKYVNKENKDQLIFSVECGLMLHAAGEFENSNKVFFQAAKLSDEMAVKVTQQAASLFLNETVTNYRGEGFERVLIHMYLGINFLMMKNTDEARVEFKKVNDILRGLIEEGGGKFEQNPMAKYLTAIAFELAAEQSDKKSDREADFDFAYVEYKQLQILNPKLAMVYRDLMRMAKALDDKQDFAKWTGQGARFGVQYNVPDDAGELVMIYQSGLSAIKVSRGKLLSDAGMSAGIKVALGGMKLEAGVSAAAIMAALNEAEVPIPKFQKRSNKINRLILNIDGKDVGETVMLEDVATTAVKNLEADFGRLSAKVAAGIVTKAAAALAAGLIAKKAAEQFKQTKAFAGIIGMVAGAGTGAALLANIKPDLRCWHTLPENFQLCRIFLKPGEYEVKIKFIDQAGRIEREIVYDQKFVIVKGKKTFFNYRTLF